MGPTSGSAGRRVRQLPRSTGLDALGRDRGGVCVGVWPLDVYALVYASTEITLCGWFGVGCLGSRIHVIGHAPRLLEFWVFAHDDRTSCADRRAPHSTPGAGERGEREGILAHSPQKANAVAGRGRRRVRPFPLVQQRRGHGAVVCDSRTPRRPTAQAQHVPGGPTSTQGMRGAPSDGDAAAATIPLLRPPGDMTRMSHGGPLGSDRILLTGEARVPTSGGMHEDVGALACHRQCSRRVVSRGCR